MNLLIGYNVCEIFVFQLNLSVNNLIDFCAQLGTGEARQRWTIAEVTDKEYCQARKVSLSSDIICQKLFANTLISFASGHNLTSVRLFW